MAVQRIAAHLEFIQYIGKFEIITALHNVSEDNVPAHSDV
jgi:hypothetical protein